jgi:pimeloyl-ACP methyl ester carboxylesterase
VLLRSKKIKTKKIKIEVDGMKFLHANLLTPTNSEDSSSKNAIIVVCHGFSDVKETLQYLSYPFVLQGYDVLTYDARGTGKSKDAGKRSDFINRIEDYKRVIDWIKIDQILSEKRIFTIGLSIGAITALCGGFPNENVEKIVAISAMSNYRQNLPKYNPVVMLSYLMKGVNVYPSKEKNLKLSPYAIFASVKNEVPKDKWKDFSKKVFLIHSRNDRVIKFKNFKENISILETPADNQLILKKGGHSMKKNEITLVGASLKFFNS